MPRQPMSFQFDLFSRPHDPQIDQMPQWRGLLMPTREELMPLIVRLLLDHATSDPAPVSEAMRDDL